LSQICTLLHQVGVAVQHNIPAGTYVLVKTTTKYSHQNKKEKVGRIKFRIM